jgi:hypothetical protein
MGIALNQGRHLLGLTLDKSRLRWIALRSDDLSLGSYWMKAALCGSRWIKDDITARVRLVMALSVQPKLASGATEPVEARRITTTAFSFVLSGFEWRDSDTVEG